MCHSRSSPVMLWENVTRVGVNEVSRVHWIKAGGPTRGDVLFLINPLQPAAVAEDRDKRRHFCAEVLWICRASLARMWLVCGIDEAMGNGVMYGVLRFCARPSPAILRRHAVSVWEKPRTRGSRCCIDLLLGRSTPRKHRLSCHGSWHEVAVSCTHAHSISGPLTFPRLPTLAAANQAQVAITRGRRLLQAAERFRRPAGPRDPGREGGRGRAPCSGW